MNTKSAPSASALMTSGTAPHEMVALAGALVAGPGCALVFSALGVEARSGRAAREPRERDGRAFVAFLDIAYGLAGPAVGDVAAGHLANKPRRTLCLLIPGSKRTQ
jgi:hypothetical protein